MRAPSNLCAAHCHSASTTRGVERKQKRRGREKQTNNRTHSSHLNFHLNDRVPLYFSSTILEGLCNSIILVLLLAPGAVTVARHDSDKGSVHG